MGIIAKLDNKKNATFDTSKTFLGPVHLHSKTDKWDYLRSPIMKKKYFLVLTSGKFLEALGSGIGTGSIFCLSFSLSNRVQRLKLHFVLEVLSYQISWKVSTVQV